MTAREPRPLPLELRVHGVGGPQAVKMLGETDAHDVVTLPSFVPDGGDPGAPSDHRLPADGETRFAQRVAGGRVEAYEWGGLTAASTTKALWVLYLPFTLINAGGWAHGAERPTGNDRSGWNVRTSVRLHLHITHTAAYLATLTYVAWIGYLTLQLVARVWVEHVRKVDEPEGLLADIVLLWVPRVAPLACVALVLGLLVTPVMKGMFEKVLPADPGVDRTAPWPHITSLDDPQFFAHQRSHRRRQLSHQMVGAAGLLAVLLQYMVGWNRLGIVLLALAGAQVVVLFFLGVTDLVARNRRLPAEVFARELIDEVHVDNKGSRMPAGAAFVVLGTALAHAAFAGLAMTLSPLLARWPENVTDDELPVGPELGAGDVLAWALLLLLLLAVAVLLTGPKAVVEENRAGRAKQGAPVRLARQAPRLALAALLAFVVPVAVYLCLNIRGMVDATEEGPAEPGETAEQVQCHGWHQVQCWYSSYEVNDGAIAKRLGAFVLLVLPGAVFGSLRRKHETGFGRVVGNVWDVLTFWPRRFHPYGAPCSAERAVPELRARIRLVHDGLRAADETGFVVVAHSQGSVLSAAAIASLPPSQAPGLVTFGSPLGTLYAPTWPSYIPTMCVTVSRHVRGDAATQPAWLNFWRNTDPIGAEVPGARNVPLREPQAPPVDDLAEIRDRRPLERPPRWGTVAGHNLYLAEPQVREAIADRRADGIAP